MRSPLNDSPIRRRRSAIAALVAVTALLLAGCGGDDGGDETTGGDASSTTATTEAPSTADSSTASSTSEAPATTEADDEGGETSPPDETATTAEPTEGPLDPGDPCSIEEGDPDCIDPDGDGEGVYLIGGAECAANAPDISICEDLDGDGNAGYPDEYEELPTCSDEVPPPCNNEPGSNEE